MLWLGLHFPALAQEVFHLGESLRDKDPAEALAGATGPRVAEPRVIVEDNRVVLCNAAALNAGIVQGCTLATAHSIVSGLRHHQREPEREARRLRQLGEMLYRFSAHISLASPSGLVLEAGGSLRLFGDVAALAQQVEALCGSLGHEVCCRWAKTPLAALLLARSRAAQIDEVPLSCMNLNTDQVERLANMGIYSLGQLLSLPRQSVARRFGQHLVDELQRLSGTLPDPQPCLQPAQQFHHDLHLLEPIHSKEALLFPMQRLLIELHHWLIGRQLGAELLVWHFAAAGGHPERRLRLPVSFARPQQHQESFLGITRLRLEQAELPDDVMSIGLEARRLQPWSADSRLLFQQLPGEAGSAWQARELEDLVDELRARLGRSACCSIEVLDQHCPENAWARAPISNRHRTDRRRTNQRRSASGAVQQAPAALPPTRPLWLFEPPRAMAPEKLTLLRGPERIQAGWWQEGQCRDYYVARHEDGAECWAFVDAHDRWYLHGYFS